MNKPINVTILPVVFLLLCSILNANTYYVDVKGGEDANPGNQKKPFKAIQAAANIVQPGDTVLVAPGRYPEEVRLKTAGTKLKPIVFKSLQKHKAILDGSAPLQGFSRCISAEQAGGNKQFEKIYYINMPKGIDAHGANLFEGDRRLYMAQAPAPNDWFYYDDRKSFLPIPNAGYSPTSLIDKEFLVNKFRFTKSTDWDGAVVMLWTADNRVLSCDLQTFNPTTGKITFSKSTRYINIGKDRFAMANHPRLLNAPGQFAIGQLLNGVRKLYLWPYDDKNINKSISCSIRKVGFHLNFQGYNTIDGFCIEKYGGNKGELRAGIGILNYHGRRCQGIKILNNEVRHCRSAVGYWAIQASAISDLLIANNYVHHNQHNRGIGTTGSTKHHVSNITIKNNIVEQCGGTGITFYYVENSKIINNRVIGNRGNHANGITVYLHSSNITIANNTVLNGNMAITVNQSNNVTIYNNLLTGKRDPKTGKNRQSRILVLYGGGENIRILNNTVLFSTKNFAISIPKDAKGYIVKNNISAGFGIAITKFTDSELILANNIYLGLLWNMKKPLGKKSKLIKKWELLFKNVKNNDFSLRKNSVAIDSGEDTSKIVKTDILGVTRPQGKEVDIGAYEYKSSY